MGCFVVDGQRALDSPMTRGNWATGRKPTRGAVLMCQERLMSIGVLCGCFGRQIDGDSWFTWWFNHLPGPSIV